MTVDLKVLIAEEDRKPKIQRSVDKSGTWGNQLK